MIQSVDGLDNKQLKDAIALLLELGYRLVVIDGDLIHYTEWNATDANNEHTQLKGSVINHVILKYLNLLNVSVRTTLTSSAKSQYDPLLQELDRQPIYEYNYHRDIKWVMYFNR